MKEYFENACKYSTVKRYKETFETIKKARYKLSTITPYILNQALLKLVQKVKTKEIYKKNLVTIDTNNVMVYNLIRLMKGDIM